MSVVWIVNSLQGLEAMGFVPSMIDDRDPDPAAKQFHKRYCGGWHPLPDSAKIDPETGVQTYPGDPPMYPLAVGHLRDETIYVYPHAFVGIVQADGSCEVSRLD